MVKRSRSPLAALLGLAASVLVAQGCASSSAALRSWEGRSSSELIASWGAPLQVLPGEQGGTILVYESTRSNTTPGYTEIRDVGHGADVGYAAPPFWESDQTITASHPSTASESTTVRMFWVSADGRITRSAEKRENRVRFAE